MDRELNMPRRSSTPPLADEKEGCSNLKGDEEHIIPGDENIHYLSEKAPFFDIVLTATYVDPSNQLRLPLGTSTMFPSTDVVPVVLRHGGKSWMMHYKRGVSKAAPPRFDVKWQDFVKDNRLKRGDACVFELIDSSPTMLVFNVHILRDDLPTELCMGTAPGEAANTPIVID